MFDIAIIGAGPAGLSAALNAYQRNKSFVIFGRPEASWVSKTEQVNNYLGMRQMAGPAMMKAFLEQLSDTGVSIQDKKVLQIFNVGTQFSINASNEFINAKAIIIATGSPKSATFPNEKSYVGKGLSYCATCDGMFYRGKEVFVFGEGEEAVKDANFLCEICAKVYYYPRKDVEGLHNSIEIVKEKPKHIVGEGGVTGVLLGEDILPCDGVFIIRESSPLSSIIDNIEMEKQFIKVDRQMHTSLQGVFACGDCTGKPLQIAKAVGEGLVAALSACDFLSENNSLGEKE